MDEKIKSGIRQVHGELTPDVDRVKTLDRADGWQIDARDCKIPMDISLSDEIAKILVGTDYQVVESSSSSIVVISRRPEYQKILPGR